MTLFAQTSQIVIRIIKGTLKMQSQKRRIIISISLIVVLVRVILYSDTALAETKIFSYAKGITYIQTSHQRVYSRTESNEVRDILRVHLRAWGNSPNPLKEEDYETRFNVTATSYVHTCYCYTGAIHVSRHQAEDPPHNELNFYTSHNGNFSTSNCWNTGCY